MPSPDTAAGSAPEQPHRFGDALRAAREQAGRSVQEVAAATRLRPAVLRDLERGELGSCGGPTYARLHVRSIARVLGTDPAPLLAALELEQQQALPPLAEAVPLQVSRSVALGGAPGQVPDRRGPHWGAAAVAALTVLVVLLGIGTLDGGERRPTAPADDLLAQAPPRASASAAPRPAPPRTGSAAPAGGAALRLRVADRASWVRVQGSSGTLFEGMLPAGSPPREFRDARELRVLIGNAAAVGVACGSKQVPPSGAAGEVRRFTCTAQGLTAA